MTDAHKETLSFQAEVQQLLNLMIHSLYSNKEIFLRELISNGSDACDKLRFEALSDDSLYEQDPEPRIRISLDKSARSITISDSGIGMTREEVQENIGTIARSGTRRFLDSLSGDQKKDANLIGQFGVGFYSSFIVADRVTLTSRRAGLGSDQGVRWESDGTGSYTLESIDLPQRGTSVTLHLREGEEDFLDQWRIESVIRKYSDHIQIPVELLKEQQPELSEGEEEQTPEPKSDWQRINRASALWARPKNEIEEAEYRELYKHISHDFEEPLAWTHNRVEGKLEYISLLYIPTRAPFDLWERDRAHGIKLYVQRVFIMDDSEHLMPRYLRFVRGVIDSNDLPLNVSREILQDNKIVDSIRSGSVKKILSLLEEMAKEEPEKYTTFWGEFGRALKEGPAEDYSNREQIARLLRFASTANDSAEQSVALADYIGRMKEGQERIFYITADSYTAARNSPHLEALNSRGVEVLLMFDRVDEWLMSHLTEFDGKPFISVAKGDLDLDSLGESEKSEEEKPDEEAPKAKSDLLERIKGSLGERVREVKASQRLVDSPSCVVIGEHDMALHMQRLLKEAGHEIGDVAKPILELNLKHPVLTRIEQLDGERFDEWSILLLDQALLAEGGQLEDPAGFVKRVNQLLLSD